MVIFFFYVFNLVRILKIIIFYLNKNELIILIGCSNEKDDLCRNSRYIIYVHVFDIFFLKLLKLHTQKILVEI